MCGVTQQPPEAFDARGLDSILRGAHGVNCVWSSAKDNPDSASTERGSLDACAADSLWGQIRSACFASRGGVDPATRSACFASRGGVVPAPRTRMFEKTPVELAGLPLPLKRQLTKARRLTAQNDASTAQIDALTRELAEARGRERRLERQLSEERQHRADLAAFFRQYRNSPCESESSWDPLGASARVVLQDMPAHINQWLEASLAPWLEAVMASAAVAPESVPAAGTPEYLASEAIAGAEALAPPAAATPPEAIPEGSQGRPRRRRRRRKRRLPGAAAPEAIAEAVAPPAAATPPEAVAKGSQRRPRWHSEYATTWH
jgi:hypothetical protein